MSERTKHTTELVVALDGSGRYPCIRDLAYALKDEAGVKWIKVGPQSLSQRFLPMTQTVNERFRVFLDLKLADTADTVRESVKRFADAGIAAVSTFTVGATVAAAEAAEGSDLRVWQVLMLTDDAAPPISGLAPRSIRANGVICPPRSVSLFEGCGIDVVTPGVRLKGETANGHVEAWSPSFVSAAGATHAVVGRPIWQAADPVDAARVYLEALRNDR